MENQSQERLSQIFDRFAKSLRLTQEEIISLMGGKMISLKHPCDKCGITELDCEEELPENCTDVVIIEILSRRTLRFIPVKPRMIFSMFIAKDPESGHIVCKCKKEKTEWKDTTSQDLDLLFESYPALSGILPRSFAPPKIKRGKKIPLR